LVKGLGTLLGAEKHPEAFNNSCSSRLELSFRARSALIDLIQFFIVLPLVLDVRLGERGRPGDGKPSP
jgi:hypothetical protein